MTGGTRIRALIAGSADDSASHDQSAIAAFAKSEGIEAPPADAWPLDEWLDDQPPAPSRGWILPVVAVLAAAGWSAFFAWANTWALYGVTAQQGIDLATSWAIPVLLICALWLIAMRNSRREALRFGDTARLLSDEAQRLEQRLTVVNRELSLAREFLASESRDLESLGRIAAERLSQHAGSLQSLVQANGAQVEAIANVSTSALENMEKLRGQLPVIASSAKDVTNNIANAGRTSHFHVQELIEGFKRLNEFGQASERQVDNLHGKINASIDEYAARLDAMRALADSRFAELESRSAEFRTGLDRDEVESLAAIRSRAGALMEELASSRSQLDLQEAESITSLRARLAALRDEGTALARSLRDGEAGAMGQLEASLARLGEQVEATQARMAALDQQAVQAARERIATLAGEAATLDAQLTERNQTFAAEMERRAADLAVRHDAEIQRLGALLDSIDRKLADRRTTHEAQSLRLADQGDAIVARIDAAAAHVATISAFGDEIERNLGNKLKLLADKLTAGRVALAGTDAVIIRLTDDSVRLLELLQASAQQSGVQLPAALANSESKLAELEQRISEMQESVTIASARGTELADSIAATRHALTGAISEMGNLQGGLEQGAVRHGSTLERLRDTLQTLDHDSSRVAEKAQTELSQALETLAHATREAVATMERTGRGAVSAIADALGHESAQVIDRVLTDRTAEAVGRLEQAAAHASGVSRESAVQLRDQLARIDELSGNLERRVNAARERAEEQVDSDFTRRMALITESLNSNAIDIAKALSSDVTDTAWASYLRGDRGVFTRRAVRLLDNAEARSVAQVYEEDREFRDHVSRYIHDFEAMLRQLLSTRDGHALSVTILSSDMGKLYVALAQAIERLRS